MTGGEETKALVKKWFATGITSPAGVEIVIDGFVWRGTSSMAEIFEGDDATLRGEVGLSRLTFLDKAMYANYDESQPSSNVHVMIAEGDNCLMGSMPPSRHTTETLTTTRIAS